jgi:hypothetical protein
MRGRLVVIVVMLGVTAGWSAPGKGGARPGGIVYTCSNPASGASWPMRVDTRRAVVDGNPAKITGGGISWFDPSDGSYNTFDRDNGKLTASIASSTGGYFRHAQCRAGAAP